MKKPSFKLREEIARLQEQLKHAETRDAERIGRIALKSGLGEIALDEAELQAAFEDVARRFRASPRPSSGEPRGGEVGGASSKDKTVATGAPASGPGEA
jgi:hypothetical protein